MTYLDGVQYEASITPGVGSYNTALLRVYISLFSQNQPIYLKNIKNLFQDRELFTKIRTKCLN